MSKFPNHYFLKLFQKFRKNFFQISLTKLTVAYDYFPDIYLKFLSTKSVLKNFLKIACFKNFITVLWISSEFPNMCQFPQNFRIPFFSNYSQGKVLQHIFVELWIPKFAWSLLLKILNTVSNYFPMQHSFTQIVL